MGAGDGSGAGDWHRKSYAHPFRMTFLGYCNTYVYVCMKLLVRIPCQAAPALSG